MFRDGKKKKLMITKNEIIYFNGKNNVKLL